MEGYNRQHIEEPTLSEEERQQVKMIAQLELMEMTGGGEHALDWAVSNGERFDKIFNDPECDYYSLLSNEQTHDKALQEIKNKLYH